MPRSAPVFLLALVLVAASFLLTRGPSDPDQEPMEPPHQEVETDLEPVEVAPLLAPSAGGEEVRSGWGVGPTFTTAVLLPNGKPALESEVFYLFRTLDQEGRADGDREAGRVLAPNGEAELPCVDGWLLLAARSPQGWSRAHFLEERLPLQGSRLALEIVEPSSKLEVRVVGPDGEHDHFDLRLSTLDPRNEESRRARLYFGALSFGGDRFSPRRPGVAYGVDASPFRLDGLPPDILEVDASAPGLVRAPQTIDLQPGETRLLEFTLGLGGTLTAAVRSPSGEPVEGAVLLCYEDEGGLSSDAANPFAKLFRKPPSARLRSESDEAGRFLIRAAPPGHYRLAIESQRYLPPLGVHEVEVIAGQVVHAGVFTLEPSALLTVEVVCPGAPEAWPELSYRPADIPSSDQPFAGFLPGRQAEGWIKPTRVRGTQNRFRLPALPTTSIELLADATNFEEKVTRVDLVIGEEREVTIELGRGLSLAGTVLDGITGEAVEGVQVEAFLWSDTTSSSVLNRLVETKAQMRTNEDGRFRLSGLTAGMFGLRTRSDRYAEGRFGPFGVAPEPTEVELRLRPGGGLRVTVLSEGGLPLRGWRVSPVGVGEGTVLESKLTDPEGIALFEHLPPGNYYVTVVPETAGAEPDVLDPESMPEFSLASAEIVEGEVTEITIGGASGTASLFGWVTVGGLPVEQPMSIMLLGDQAKIVSGKVEEGGWYEFTGVDPGDYALVLTSSRMLGGSTWTEPVSLQAGEQEHNFDLPDRSVTVRVVDAGTWKPVAGEPVTLRTLEHRPGAGGMDLTDADGTVTFSMLRPGSYIAVAGRASMPFLPLGSKAVGVGRSDPIVVAEYQQGPLFVDIELGAPADLQGRILDSHANPVAGAGVYWLSSDGQPLTAFCMSGSGADGSFLMQGLSEGPGILLARHAQLGEVRLPMNLEAGENGPVDVVLEAGTVLLIDVVDEEGNRLSGVSALLLDLRGNPVSTLYTGSEASTVGLNLMRGGQQRLGPFAPGDYTLLLADITGTRTVTFPQRIESGLSELPLTLTFAP